MLDLLAQLDELIAEFQLVEESSQELKNAKQRLDQARLWLQTAIEGQQ